MKRRTESHGLSGEDIGMKRIVRHKGTNHDSLSPEIERSSDSRKRTVSDRDLGSSSGGGGSSGNYDKYSGSGGGKYSGSSHRDHSLERSSIDRHSSSNRRASYPESSRHSKGSYGAGGGSGPNHILDQIDFSLHISNLDMRPPDEELKKVLFKEFKKYGYITVKVLGYGKERRAFINYQHYDEAKRAKKDKQRIVLFNRPINVEWSKSTLIKYPDVASGRKPSTSSDVTSNSFIDDFHVGGSSSHDHHSRSRDHHTDTSYNSHHSGSHEHHTESHDRSRSHDHRNGSSDHRHHSRERTSDHKRDVSYRRPSTTDSKSVLDSNATRTLFVGNLELDVTERELRDLFSQYGRIESVDIKLAKSAGTSYSFIKFTTITDAINAKNEMHGHLFGTFRLKIGFGKGSPTGKVWVGNLSNARDLAEVRHEMDRFGLIRRCDYRDHDTHAYVHFESLDAAQAAVHALQNMRLRNGKTVRLDIHKPLHMRELEDDFPPASHHESNDYSSGGHHHKSRSSSHHHHRDVDSFDHETRKDKPDDHHLRHSHHSSKDRIVTEEDRNYRKRPRTSQTFDKHSDAGSFSGEYSSTKRHCTSLDYESPKRSSSVGKDYQHRPYYHHSKRGGRRGDHTHSSESSPRHRSHRGHSSDDKQHTENKDTATSGDKDQTNCNGGDAPPPPPPLSADAVASSSMMMEGDTALKLSDATEPVSPDSDGKGPKPDSTHPETLSELGKSYPIAWRGNLVLKNTGFPARLHLVGGESSVAEYLLKSRGKDEGKDEPCVLKITQRLQLVPSGFDEVNERLTKAGSNGHCILLALPGPTDEGDNSMQLRPLRSLVSYLSQKQAAGIVTLSSSDIGDGGSENGGGVNKEEVIGVLHAFPPCEFSQARLMKAIPNLSLEPSKEDHIVILLVKGNV
uniref:RNA-binding protein 15B n=1 Tax=Amphimedon queenslandica TaxID=400682 RepID=A0A1X7UH93_AMPQE